MGEQWTCQEGGEQSLLFSSGGRLTSLQRDGGNAGVAAGCGTSLVIKIWKYVGGFSESRKSQHREAENPFQHFLGSLLGSGEGRVESGQNKGILGYSE